METCFKIERSPVGTHGARARDHENRVRAMEALMRKEFGDFVQDFQACADHCLSNNGSTLVALNKMIETMVFYSRFSGIQSQAQCELIQLARRADQSSIANKHGLLVNVKDALTTIDAPESLITEASSFCS